MLSHPMSRSVRRSLLVVPLAAVAMTVLGACGEEGIQLAANDPDHQGALIFTEHCSGCHTIAAAGTQGSASNIRSREYKDGPNFDQRKEQLQQILYAIRNGGFSSGPMPQNIVTGKDAELVARFVAKYSGSQAKRPPGPQNAAPTGFNQGTGPAGGDTKSSDQTTP